MSNGEDPTNGNGNGGVTAAVSGPCGCDLLMAQTILLGQQIVADNSRLAQNTLLAYQKDLFQGGQGELGTVLAALRGSKSVPVVSTGQ